MNSDTKTALLEAAMRLIRTKGYSATTVDDLCKAAGVSKGAFFHHFSDKAALGIAAADYWGSMTGALFAAAPYHGPDDPVDRVMAYIDFRKMLVAGEIPEFTCVAGTMAQEIHALRPEVNEACGRAIAGHAASLEDDFASALVQCGVTDVSAKALALHTQVVIQGAFVVAKALEDPAVAIESIDHLRRYLELLFRQGNANSSNRTGKEHTG